MKGTVLVAILCVAAAAQGASKNSALVTQVLGEVVYTMPLPGSEPIRVRAFQRARQGDIYAIPGGAKLRIVYTGTGRQEFWTGPAQFTVGSTMSTYLAGEKPTLTQLPAVGARAIGKVPGLLKQVGRAKIGAVRLRSADVIHGITWRTVADLNVQELKALAETQSNYKEMKKGLAPNDPTADLVLVSGLYSLGLRMELEAAVKHAIRSFPKEMVFVRINGWLHADSRVKAPAEGEEMPVKEGR